MKDEIGRPLAFYDFAGGAALGGFSLERLGRRGRIESSPFVRRPWETPIMSSPHDDFAPVLLARKVISPEQLIEAWELVARVGIHLDIALVRLGYATEVQIAEA